MYPLTSTAKLEIKVTESVVDGEVNLVDLAQCDRKQFSHLYRANADFIFAHIFRRTGNRHLSEDLTGDVFIEAMNGLSGFEYRGIPIRAWLLRIATFRVNRWASRERRLHVSLPESLQLAIETSSADRAAFVRRALLKMPCKLQAVLCLFYLEDLSIDDVSKILSIRPGTVKSRLGRGREKLRALLSQEGSNER